MRLIILCLFMSACTFSGTEQEVSQEVSIDTVCIPQVRCNPIHCVDFGGGSVSCGLNPHADDPCHQRCSFLSSCPIDEFSIETTCSQQCHAIGATGAAWGACYTACNNNFQVSCQWGIEP